MTAQHFPITNSNSGGPTASQCQMMMGIVLVSDKRIIILSFLKIMRKIELPGACTVKAQHVVQSTEGGYVLRMEHKDYYYVGKWSVKYYYTWN